MMEKLHQTGGDFNSTHLKKYYCSQNGLRIIIQMGVSKNSGTPKWMAKIMENPIRMDDLGVPLFLETPK